MTWFLTENRRLYSIRCYGMAKNKTALSKKSSFKKNDPVHSVQTEDISSEILDGNTTPHGFIRDANHLDFCRILRIFKSDFPILDIKIPANNDFKMVLDKIKEVAPPLNGCGENYTCSQEVKLGCFPLRTKLICALFIGKT